MDSYFDKTIIYSNMNVGFAIQNSIQVLRDSSLSMSDAMVYIEEDIPPLVLIVMYCHSDEIKNNIFLFWVY